MFKLSQFAALGLAAALAFTISPATAATITVSATLPTKAIANPNPTATGSTGAVNPPGTPAYYNNVVGNQFTNDKMVARSPWEDTDLFATGVYSSVSQNSFAIFDFDKLQTGFSLVWGSPDTWNNLLIELISGGNVATINGVQMVPPGVSGLKAVLLTVTNVEFDRLKLTSDQNAFEFANLTATPVPLPAAAWMLIAGVGGLVALGRRRRANA